MVRCWKHENTAQLFFLYLISGCPTMLFKKYCASILPQKSKPSVLAHQRKNSLSVTSFKITWLIAPE
jgi:hypothetical protein